MVFACILSCCLQNEFPPIISGTWIHISFRLKTCFSWNMSGFHQNKFSFSRNTQVSSGDYQVSVIIGPVFVRIRLSFQPDIAVFVIILLTFRSGTRNIPSRKGNITFRTETNLFGRKLIFSDKNYIFDCRNRICVNQIERVCKDTRCINRV